MGKKIIIFVAFLVSISVSAQEVDRKGLLKGTLTYSPGLMLDNNNQPFYLHGILEYYVSETVSAVGEGSYYLGDLRKNELFRYNNTIFAGFNWHPLPNGPSDLFIGLQPGVSFTMLSQQTSSDRIGINPVTCLNIGYNYFLNEYFQFFFLTKTILGKHSTYSLTSLNEFRISAGLAFSIPLRR